METKGILSDRRVSMCRTHPLHLFLNVSPCYDAVYYQICCLSKRIKLEHNICTKTPRLETNDIYYINCYCYFEQQAVFDLFVMITPSLEYTQSCLGQCHFLELFGQSHTK
jgi:hypothetical protein